MLRKKLLRYRRQRKSIQRICRCYYKMIYEYYRRSNEISVRVISTGILAGTLPYYTSEIYERKRLLVFIVVLFTKRNMSTHMELLTTCTLGAALYSIRIPLNITLRKN